MSARALDTVTVSRKAATAADDILDGVARALAGCASREIRPTIRQVLATLAGACGARVALLVERGLVLFHVPTETALSGHPASSEPDAAWLRSPPVQRDDAFGTGLVVLDDWMGHGGRVLAHPFGPAGDGSMLALRWEPDSPLPGSPAAALQSPDEIAGLIRRIGAIIEAALQREDLAEERRTLLRRLSESQNLDIASATAVALAHNLNNILAAMLGHTEIALDALRNHPQGHAAVMAIRNASERAAELIESILGFGQRDIPVDQVVMRQLVDETIELIGPAIPERIALDFEADAQASSDVVFGRAAELQQILFNLIRNAAQAIPGEGHITIGLSRRMGDERLPMQLGALNNRAYTVVTVADDGVGIDAEMRATIFRPFYTTRPAGTGLGLSAVAESVGEHEGAIRVLSGPGGTTFEIWLPCSRLEAGGPRMIRGEGQPVVLVAPDTMRERFEDIVAALGYEPEAYREAGEALEATLFAASPPHALLLCTSSADLDQCIVMGERFRLLPQAVPMTIAVPGRMPPTPMGRIAGRQTWLAGSENNNAIAACMRLMADVAGLSNEGATT